MRDSGLTRSGAKTEVLRCLNLVSDLYIPAVLKPFHKDILLIRDHLYRKNIEKNLTKLGKYAMSREGWEGKTLEKKKISLQSQYCATEESRGLLVLYEVCLRKGLLDRNVSLDTRARCISFIPFFDGAYISFEDLEGPDCIDQIIEDTNKLIYPYSFEQKEIAPD